MPETYDEIIEEIERLDTFNENYTFYLNKHGIKKRHQWKSTDMALDIAARVREAVGGDPSEWWVEDADGNRVHIGDEVRKGEEPPDKVMGLGAYGEAPVVFVSFSAWNYADRVHKIVPDTREKIIEDAMAKFTYDIIPVKTREVIEEAIDRAMKLAEVDA